MVRKPWYVRLLDQIDQFAHEASMQALIQCGEFLRGCELSETEQTFFLRGFDTILGDLTAPEQAYAKDYLGKIRFELTVGH